MTTGILNQITTSWMHHPNRTGKSSKNWRQSTLQEREAMLQAASIQDNTPYQLVF